jgi:hypothetical protein
MGGSYLLLYSLAIGSIGSPMDEKKIHIYIYIYIYTNGNLISIIAF